MWGSYFCVFYVNLIFESFTKYSNLEEKKKISTPFIKSISMSWLHLKILHSDVMLPPQTCILSIVHLQRYFGHRHRSPRNLALGARAKSSHSQDVQMPTAASQPVQVVQVAEQELKLVSTVSTFADSTCQSYLGPAKLYGEMEDACFVLVLANCCWKRWSQHHDKFLLFYHECL